MSCFSRRGVDMFFWMLGPFFLKRIPWRGIYFINLNGTWTCWKLYILVNQIVSHHPSQHHNRPTHLPFLTLQFIWVKKKDDDIITLFWRVYYGYILHDYTPGWCANGLSIYFVIFSFIFISKLILVPHGRYLVIDELPYI